MACRKDGKGRVLRKGEGYRKGDGRYSYVYIDPLGKKRTIYAKSLVRLQRKRRTDYKKTSWMDLISMSQERLM